MGIKQIELQLKAEIETLRAELKKSPIEILEFLEDKFDHIDKKFDALNKKNEQDKEKVDYMYEFGKGIFRPNSNGTLLCPFTCQSKEMVTHLHQENENLSMVYGDAYLVKLREFEKDIAILKKKYPMIPLNPITLIDRLFLITKGDKNNG